MLKRIVTLFAGASRQQAEAFMDRHALTLLQEQMRNGAQDVKNARNAVAVAMAQNELELRQQKKLLERIKDLETRAIAALDADKNDLAREAAEAIAVLEAEHASSQEALDRFAKDISRLKANVKAAEMKLRELERGQRFATATDRTQRLGQQAPASGLSSLAEAQETLTRLRARQTHLDLTEKAMHDLNDDDPARMVEKLAEAGCGKPLRTSADDVFDRLKKKRKSDAKTK